MLGPSRLFQLLRSGKTFAVVFDILYSVCAINFTVNNDVILDQLSIDFFLFGLMCIRVLFGFLRLKILITENLESFDCVEFVQFIVKSDVIFDQL